MNPIIICLILSASITYIYDYVAFPRNFLARIYSLLFKLEIRTDQIKLPKLLECSLCATTWTSLVVLLIANWKMAPLCLVFGWLTSYELLVFTLIDKLINCVIYLFDKMIEKLTL